MERITADTARQLARAAGVRPPENELGTLAAFVDQIVEAVERCEELNLAAHEPATAFRLSGGPVDAEL